ncbi:hypothetical protein A2997_02125 [Candidatus Nomurabacteria bacterium RIFCSPLOWO2_01_FULL_36_10b]|uniref:EfeO-type cupredoxin-like domain-containing protein n=1 Tax=Candidatus Nomurabacteria bacterium RIFCSPLOWO2_01_FULL_36_10b TaxID=1801766 RepID=A0A1F6WPC4_9BACT|nr:MAG: hypothetical protein A2997_02125 [Candidatus Nomurabacteria bacterium RIFCSPLOWO2_01_FULL_36_10b]
MKIFLTIIGIVIIVIVIIFLVKSPSQRPADITLPTPVVSDANTTIPTTSASSTADQALLSSPKTVTFNVTGKSLSFLPDEIRVKKGDHVKINFTSMDSTHDFVIDEFSIRTDRLQAGVSDTVEFIADKTGIFEYYCSFGEHKAMGMTGTLIVE